MATLRFVVEMEPSTERTTSVPPCYSTLDAVQVPAGVPAGGCFLVSVAAKSENFFNHKRAGGGGVRVG